MKNENPFRHFVRLNEKFTTNKSNSFVETNELPIVNFNVGSDFLISAFMGMFANHCLSEYMAFLCRKQQKKNKYQSKKENEMEFVGIAVCWF